MKYKITEKHLKQSSGFMLFIHLLYVLRSCHWYEEKVCIILFHSEKSDFEKTQKVVLRKLTDNKIHFRHLEIFWLYFSFFG